MATAFGTTIAGIAGLRFIRPSPKTAGLEAVLEELDAFHDTELEAGHRRLLRTLAQIAAIESELGRAHEELRMAAAA